MLRTLSRWTLQHVFGCVFAQSGTGQLSEQQNTSVWGRFFPQTWLHDCMWSAWKFVNIDCVFFFFIALVSYCTCTGCMATVQHLYGSVCLLGTPTCMCTGKYSYQHTFREKERRNPLTRWALPHQNYERSENCTILCQYRYGTVHLCSVEKE